jgi:hypothetical protein
MLKSRRLKLNLNLLLKGIKAAGARARKSTLEIEKLLKNSEKFLSKNQKIIFFKPSFN